jgi:GT2 family glycosyltransferase
MDDPGLAGVVDAAGPSPWKTTVPAVERRHGLLPLAAARNAGARAAAEQGSTTLVFLDVDCIPSEKLVARYAEVLTPSRRGAAEWERPIVACGEVLYLDAAPAGTDYRDCDLSALARAHPARPALAAGDVQRADDVSLFWSLSFGVTTDDWELLGGFDEDYVGYGGEDTDFGQRVRTEGGTMLWIGGALAHHQHHATSSPPVRHLEEIVDNANRFAAKWGWWPMEGWLTAFEEAGLATRTKDGSWVACPDAHLRDGVVSAAAPRHTTG